MASTEWASLVHAYEAYVEGREQDYTVEETKDVRVNELEEVRNPKRLELLLAISTSHVESINDLARKAGRNVKNVYNDLRLLEKGGYLRFRKVGKRNLVPETLVEEISVLVQ